eukprot:GHRR01034410.1.p2 GENE.GHRR01034410.1~~GHRR01034410.1.p2  ORF type:complete len:151 (+),score=34.40 GHRR01034410.1:2316-2768(+)
MLSDGYHTGSTSNSAMLQGCFKLKMVFGVLCRVCKYHMLKRMHHILCKLHVPQSFDIAHMATGVLCMSMCCCKAGMVGAVQQWHVLLRADAACHCDCCFSTRLTCKEVLKCGKVLCVMTACSYGAMGMPHEITVHTLVTVRWRFMLHFPK